MELNQKYNEPELFELIKEFRSGNNDYATIADMLNERGYRTKTNKVFSGVIVSKIAVANGLRTIKEYSKSTVETRAEKPVDVIELIGRLYKTKAFTNLEMDFMIGKLRK